MPFNPIKNRIATGKVGLFLLTLFILNLLTAQVFAGVLYQQSGDSPEFNSNIYIDFIKKTSGVTEIHRADGQSALIELENGKVQASLQFSSSLGEARKVTFAFAPVSFKRSEILLVASAGTGIMFVDTTGRLTLVFVSGFGRDYKLEAHEFKLPAQLIGEIQKNQVASLAKYNDRLLIALNGTGWLRAGKLYSIDLRTGLTVNSELFYEKLLKVDLVPKDKTVLVITDKIASGFYDSILGRSGQLFYIRGVDLRNFGSDWADNTELIHERYTYSAKRAEILQKLGSQQGGGQP